MPIATKKGNVSLFRLFWRFCRLKTLQKYTALDNCLYRIIDSSDHGGVYLPEWLQEKDMDDRETVAAPDRRDFLKIVAVTGPAAAAVAVAGTPSGAAEADQRSSLLMETEHTRAYYESARF